MRRPDSKRTPQRMRDQARSVVEAAAPAPVHWASSCTHRECTLHQLSPYIGKLKSTIARDLIDRYSKPGDLVVDMFCGAGTIPLEAAILGRRVFASDASEYAVTLTKGKLYAPPRLDIALTEIETTIGRVDALPLPDLQDVPAWVQSFFHPCTLRETLRILKHLRERRNHFLVSSILGILHHQRPGFLSYPSSHLVPYVRSKKYPRESNPGLYAYREVASRLRKKVTRAFKRPPRTDLRKHIEAVRRSSVEYVTLPNAIDCVITSPPYMNALDYERDNRLRLWFVGDEQSVTMDRKLKRINGFARTIRAVARQLVDKVNTGGHCVFVVGDRITRSGGRIPSEELIDIFSDEAPALRLDSVIRDAIPDVRRARRNVAGVKQESILVFRKVAV